MSARGITQQEIYDEARNHLRLILPLLERIGSGSAAQVSAGYVGYDERQERFTCMGRSTVTIAEIVAWDSATYLYADVLGKTTGEEDTRLLRDVQRLLAVTACTLKGLDVDNAPGLNGTWVASCLWDMASDLLGRAEPLGEAVAP